MLDGMLESSHAVGEGDQRTVVVFYRHDDFAAGAVDVLAVECEDKAGRLAPRGSHAVDAILSSSFVLHSAREFRYVAPDTVASCRRTKTRFEQGKGSLRWQRSATPCA